LQKKISRQEDKLESNIKPKPLKDKYDIEFLEIFKETYNKSFCIDAKSCEIDDKIVSDNGDMEKVLATVISIIYAFTEEFPDKWVYITGSSPTRTRLYRIIIMKYLSIVESDFTLRCWQNGEWKDFYPNINCQGFVLKRKNNK